MTEELAEEKLEEKLDFWKAIEEKIKCEIPLYLQNLLTSQGFNNALSLKDLDNDDVKFLEEFARSEGYLKTLRVKREAGVDLEPYLGSYQDTQEEFCILRGHKKLVNYMVDAARQISSQISHGFSQAKVAKRQNLSAKEPVKKSSDASSTPNSSINYDLNKEHDDVFRKIKTWLSSFLDSFADSNKQACTSMKPDMVNVKLNIDKNESLSDHPFTGLAYCPICKKGQTLSYKVDGGKVSWCVSNFARHMKLKHSIPASKSNQSSKTTQPLLHFYTNNPKNTLNDLQSKRRMSNGNHEILDETTTTATDYSCQTSHEILDETTTTTTTDYSCQKSHEILDETTTTTTTTTTTDYPCQTSQPRKKVRHNVIRDDNPEVEITEPELKLNEDNFPGESQTGSLKRANAPVLYKLNLPPKKSRNRQYKNQRQLNSAASSSGQTRITNYFKILNEVQMLTNRIKSLQDCIKSLQITKSEDLTSNDSLDSDSVLALLFNSAMKNGSRYKHGYRHDETIKMFASYLRILGGNLLYETLHANLPSSIPSPSTISSYISDRAAKITEGALRTDELLSYLSDRNLPSVVSVSEDATRMVGKAVYDGSSNKILGFCLPLNKHGMPETELYLARNVAEIIQLTIRIQRTTTS